MKTMKKSRVVTDANIIFGKARIKGTRISVEQFLSCLSAGWSEKKITEEFGITSEDIHSVIEYSNDLLKRTQIVKLKNFMLIPNSVKA